jgi:hypothetical protein
MTKIWNKKFYSNDPIDIINIKLKHFKKFFKCWGSNLFGNAKKRKLEHKEELASLEALEKVFELPHDLSIRKTDISVELMELYANEELLWFRKSHEKWFLECDSNTSYFHSAAKGCKRKIPCTLKMIMASTLKGLVK